MIRRLLFYLFCFFTIISKAQIITTIAGNGTAGYTGDGGQATLAELNNPADIAVDALGNLYIADNINNLVRKVNSLGIITTIAGNGLAGFSGDGGQATAAKFNAPSGLISDVVGNIYISDYYNNRIRKINTLGIVTTVAGNGTLGFSGDGGQATAAEINNPLHIAIDAVGNLYIPDNGNNRVRKVNTAGIITTVVGNGINGYSGDGNQATAAELSAPTSLAFDVAGNMYVADCNGNRVRKINTSGIISTFAGNGTGAYLGDGGQATAAELNHPIGVFLDVAGNLYIADRTNNRIRKVNTLGIITTIVGNGTGSFSGDGGQATAAELNGSTGLAFDVGGNLYIADYGNNRIRKVSPSTASTITNQPPTILPTAICAGNSATVTIPGSQTGVVYSLVAATNTNTTIGSTLTGTGNSLSFSTGIVTATTTYAIVGIIAGTQTLVMSPLVTVTVNPLPSVGITASQTVICSGTSTTLTATGASTYTWSTSATTSSITVAPSNYTTYSVTGKNTSTGCVKTSTLAVSVTNCTATVNQYCPGVNAGPDVTICTGQCTNLQASVLGGNQTSTYTVNSVHYSPYPFTGNAILVNQDDIWSAALNLGFNFCFYGNSFNKLVIGSNGEISFNTALAGTAETYTVGAALPNTTVNQGNTICAAYRDIDPVNGGNVYYEIFGLPPCRTFVVSWVNIPLFGYVTGTPNSTFQVALHESTNIIDVYLQNSFSYTDWNGGRGIIGIQNSTGTTAVCPPNRNFPTTWTAINEGWQFTPIGAANYTISWNSPSGQVSAAATASVCPPSTTTYTAAIAVTNCDGSISNYSDNLTVHVNSTTSFTPTISSSSSGCCAGSSVTLTASGGSVYSWLPSAGLSVDTGATVVASPIVATTYTVTGSSGSCAGKSVSTITITPIPIISITKDSICAGSSTVLSASGAVNYTWSPSTGLSTNTGSVVTAHPTVTTYYTITGNKGGCVGASIVPLKVMKSPTQFVNPTNATCIPGNGSISVSDTGGTSPYTYAFNSGAYSASNIITGLNAGTYTIFTKDNNGCKASSVVTITQASISNPTIVINSDTICLGNNTTLTAHGASTYTWQPSTALSNSVSTSVVASPTSSITYTVIGTDINNCKGYSTSTVTVLGLTNSLCTISSNSITVHNAFSPNNDGLNDVFVIDNISEFPTNHVYIYNRWGQLIWDKAKYDNVNTVWDGKTQTGVILYAGTYFYVVEIDGKSVAKGWIELTK